MNCHKIRNMEFMRTSTAQIGAGYGKVSNMTGVGMLLFFWREIATGELTLGNGDTIIGDAEFRKSLMKMIYRKLPKKHRHDLSPVTRPSLDGISKATDNIRLRDTT